MYKRQALAVAGMLKAQMYEKAVSAVRSMKAKTVSQDFIDVVNLNIYTASTVQALGIKAVRNGIAHSVQNGLTLLEGSHEDVYKRHVRYGAGSGRPAVTGQGSHAHRRHQPQAGYHH